jgi:Ca2+-binding RTX toxin-like protein
MSRDSFFRTAQKKKKAPVTRTRLAVDRLEERTVLAVTGVSLADGTLTIVADNANDTIRVWQFGGNTGQPATYSTRVDGAGPATNDFELLKTWSGQNGVPVNQFGIITGVTKVVVKGGGGDDLIEMLQPGRPGTVVELYGEAGNDTLRGSDNTDDLLVGGLGDDTLYGFGGNDTLYGDELFKKSFTANSSIPNLAYPANFPLAVGGFKLSTTVGTLRSHPGTAGTNVAGFGVMLDDTFAGFGASRGIDGGEALCVQPADPGLKMASATLTVGLNAGAGAGLSAYAVDVYAGGTLLTTVTGTVTGAIGSLHDINVSAGGAAFDKIVLRNTGAVNTAPFSLTAVSAVKEDPTKGGNDALYGGRGSDKMFGQAGNDTLIGGDFHGLSTLVDGGDIYVGGAGADIFFKDNTSSQFLTGSDKGLQGTITDFAQGSDKIRIQAMQFSLNLATWRLQTGTASQPNKIVVDSTTSPGSTLVRLPFNTRLVLTGFTGTLTLADFEVI